MSKPNMSYECACPTNRVGINCEETEVLEGYAYVAFNGPKTWLEARDECERNNMTLTSITSQPVQDLLVTLVR